MKKKFKRFLSLIVVCMMMVSTMAISAGAATLKPDQTTGTLTLTGGEDKTDSEYSLYKVLNPVYVEGQTVYDYELTEAFEDAGYTYEQIAVLKPGSDNYKIDAATVDVLARDLENYVKANDIQADYILKAGTQTDVAIGYYLILETKYTNGYKAIKPMLVAVPSEATPGNYTYDVSVKLKEQPIRTTKTIVESEAEKAKSEAQQVDKEFTFEVAQDVPLYDDTYKNVTFKVIDKMSKGLTFVGVESVKLNNSDTPLNEDQYGFEKTEDPELGTTTLTFDFSDNGPEGTDYYDNVKAADQVIIRYKAKLNKDADFTMTGNVNEVYPTFGTDKDIITNGTPDKTKTYSGVLELKKYGEDKQALAGAEFTIYTNEDCTEEAELVTYKVNDEGFLVPNETFESAVITGKDGIAKFAGLGEGIYYIMETDAPGGYIKLKEPIKVVVTFDKETEKFSYTVAGNGVIDNTVKITDNVVTFDVENTKGFTLPTTGGMGTYIFTIGGVILIAAAVVLLIRLRKKAN